MLILKFAPADMDSKITELMDVIHCDLPSQYESFLRKYNGGETPETDLTDKCKSDVRAFYGLDVGGGWDLFEILTLKKPAELLEQGLLTIAENSAGNFFCINLSDGRIYLAYSDSAMKVYIACDFNTFISLCKSGSIDKIAKLTVEEREAAMIAQGRQNEISDELRKIWQDEYNRYKNTVQEEVILD